MSHNIFVIHYHDTKGMQKLFLIETLRKKEDFPCHAVTLVTILRRLPQPGRQIGISKLIASLVYWVLERYLWSTYSLHDPYFTYSQSTYKNFSGVTKICKSSDSHGECGYSLMASDYESLIFLEGARSIRRGWRFLDLCVLGSITRYFAPEYHFHSGNYSFEYFDRFIRAVIMHHFCIYSFLLNDINVCVLSSKFTLLVKEI